MAAQGPVLLDPGSKADSSLSTRRIQSQGRRLRTRPSQTRFGDPVAEVVVIAGFRF